MLSAIHKWLDQLATASAPMHMHVDESVEHPVTLAVDDPVTLASGFLHAHLELTELSVVVIDGIIVISATHEGTLYVHN